MLQNSHNGSSATSETPTQTTQATPSRQLTIAGQGRSGLTLDQPRRRGGTMRLGDRAFFVGHTGSGKTFLATRFLEYGIPPRLPVIVVDPKHMFEPTRQRLWQFVDELPQGWERNIRREKRPKFLRLVLRPEYMEDQRQNPALNDCYIRAFAAGRCLIYLDDLQALVCNVRAHSSLSRLVQMGRQRKISVWGSTLRPSAIPRMFISESDHMFVFRLRDEADRLRVKMLLGKRGQEPPGPFDHDFWYMPPGVSSLEPILVHQRTQDQR